MFLRLRTCFFFFFADLGISTVPAVGKGPANNAEPFEVWCFGLGLCRILRVSLGLQVLEVLARVFGVYGVLVFGVLDFRESGSSTVDMAKSHRSGYCRGLIKHLPILVLARVPELGIIIDNWRMSNVPPQTLFKSLPLASK